MTKRKTIGSTPWDSIMPPAPAPETHQQLQPLQEHKRERLSQQEPAVPASESSGDSRPAGKDRLTVHLSVDLIDRVKNAVYWTPGLTLASLAEDALRDAVERLEQERGEPYPKRRAELKGGRPLK